MPGERPQLLLELLEGRRDRAVLGHPLGGHDDAVHPVPEGRGAEPQLGLADFGHHGGQRLRSARSPPSRPAASRPWRARRGSRRRAACAPCCGRRRSRRGSASAAACRRPARRSPRGRPGSARPARSRAGSRRRARWRARPAGDRWWSAGCRGRTDARCPAGPAGACRCRRRNRRAGTAGRARGTAPADRAGPSPRCCARAGRARGHTLVGSASFSSTSTCTPCSRNSLASIKPVGPPPATITSIMKIPHSPRLHFGQLLRAVRRRTPRLRAECRDYTAGPTSGRRPARPSSTTTRTSRIPVPQVLASAGDSAARPGSCRKPPGALYIESGRECVISLPFFCRPPWTRRSTVTVPAPSTRSMSPAPSTEAHTPPVTRICAGLAQSACA